MKEFLVIGGGIAGVSCVEALSQLSEEDHITLVSASDALKGIANVVRVTDTLETFDVVERPLQSLPERYRRVRVVRGEVAALDHAARVARLADGSELRFDAVCVCSGARPKLVVPEHPAFLGVRDTESVRDLCARLREGRRVVVLGNGGIALELVRELRGAADVVWAVKDGYIGSTFFDASVSAFMMPHLGDSPPTASTAPAAAEPAEPAPPAPPAAPTRARALGSALGPDWLKNVFRGMAEGPRSNVRVEFGAELEAVQERGGSGAWRRVDFGPDEPGEPQSEWPVLLRFDTGAVVGADFVVSATGVVPCVDFCAPELPRAADGGLLVDQQLRSPACAHVFAAGDACSLPSESPTWFQMRLWSQARVMGQFAAQSMLGQVDELGAGFAFELFAHVTHIFGFKVALIGDYNGTRHAPDQMDAVTQQCVVTDGGLVLDEAAAAAAAQGRRTSAGAAAAAAAGRADVGPAEVEMLVRVTPGVEFVKLVVVRGRVKGAILIGDTDLEETVENLILNELDVSRYGIELLDPEIDIEDYFD